MACWPFLQRSKRRLCGHLTLWKSAARGCVNEGLSLDSGHQHCQACWLARQYFWPSLPCCLSVSCCVPPSPHSPPRKHFLRFLCLQTWHQVQLVSLRGDRQWNQNFICWIRSLLPQSSVKDILILGYKTMQGQSQLQELITQNDNMNSKDSISDCLLGMRIIKDTQGASKRTDPFNLVLHIPSWEHQGLCNTSIFNVSFKYRTKEGEKTGREIFFLSPHLYLF